jgi:hypothetical protein
MKDLENTQPEVEAVDNLPEVTEEKTMGEDFFDSYGFYPDFSF